MRYEIKINENIMGERRKTYLVDCFTPEEERELKGFLMARNSDSYPKRIRRRGQGAYCHLPEIDNTSLVASIKKIALCWDSNIWEKANPIIKPFIVINREKKIVVIKNSENTFKVKCHNDDEFSEIIGVGLCLGRLFKNNKSLQYLKDKLDYKEFALYCINYYFDFDKKKITTFIENIKNAKDNEKITLED